LHLKSQQRFSSNINNFQVPSPKIRSHQKTSPAHGRDVTVGRREEQVDQLLGAGLVVASGRVALAQRVFQVVVVVQAEPAHQLLAKFHAPGTVAVVIEARWVQAGAQHIRHHEQHHAGHARLGWQADLLDKNDIFVVEKQIFSEKLYSWIVT